jgi:Flp pilus assembly protein CpaB
MPTHSRNIAISIVLALVAAVALVLYTNGVRSNVEQGARTEKVVVATRDIAAGTSIGQALDRGWLTTRTVRASDLVTGAVSDAGAVSSKLIVKDMVADDQLSSARVGNQAATTAAGKVSGTQRVLRVPLNQNAGLLGELHAGDRVDVFANYTDGTKVVTTIPARHVEVLAVSSLPNQTPGAATSGSVTLKVSDVQAMALVNALRNTTGGKEADAYLWLALAGADSSESALPARLALP